MSVCCFAKRCLLQVALLGLVDDAQGFHLGCRVRKCVGGLWLSDCVLTARHQVTGENLSQKLRNESGKFTCVQRLGRRAFKEIHRRSDH